MVVGEVVVVAEAVVVVEEVVVLVVVEAVSSEVMFPLMLLRSELALKTVSKIDGLLSTGASSPLLS